jgi:hypothetical protein
MSEALCLATFRSIHHVIKAEAFLKSQGLWTDMVPNPRSISTDCGMALVIKCRDATHVKKVLAGDDAPNHIYVKSASGFILFEEDACHGGDNSTY